MPPRSARRAQKKTGDNIAMTITVDGEPYVFDTSDITSAIDRELYLQSRLTMAGVFSGMDSGNVSPFFIAALVFLARRTAGEKVTYTQVEEAIGFDSEIDVKIHDGDEVADGPEAPAAD